MDAVLNSILNLLGKVPATFWGVVAGSLFTLIGVTLTNRASDRRLRLQLESDRELNNREREMAFRKETYAAATEAIAVSLSAISKLADLTCPLEKIAATYGEQSPIIAKVNLVAGEDTIRALTNYGTEFGGAYLRLSQQRMVLTVLQEQIAGKAALLKGFEKTRDTMLELMQQHSIDGVQDAQRLETVRRIFDFEGGRITTMYQEIQQMTAELVAKHTPFARECFVESIRLNKLLVPALVAARMELELSISEERYANILYQAQPKLEGDLDEFIQKVADASAAATIS
jgi:hypothetical protein